MKIIPQNKVKDFSLILLFASFGGFWLTFWWYKKIVIDYIVGPYDSFYLYYYLFNSMVLFFTWLFFYFKKYTIYAYLSIVLGFSVFISLFIFEDAPHSLLFGNLFVNTIFLGMFFDLAIGGIILVPLLLFVVSKNLIWGIMYLRGSIDFSLFSHTFLASHQEQRHNIGGILPIFFHRKPMIHIIVPLIAMCFCVLLLVYFLYIKYLLFISISIIFLLLTGAFFSLFTKNRKLYFTLNILLVFSMYFFLFFFRKVIF